MAQELLCDRGFFCRDCACGERCYSLLFFAKFFLFGKDVAGACVAGARPAASNLQCSQLDAASGAIRRPASSNFLSPHCPGWASHTQRAPRNQSVQSPTSFLLTLFRSFFLLRCLLLSLIASPEFCRVDGNGRASGSSLRGGVKPG